MKYPALLRVNGSQRTKPREDKLLKDASVEYAPKEGVDMALADGISTPIETERQQATDLDHKLKDSEQKFVTVKRKKRKKPRRRRHVKPPD